jgi:hypothetical protein
MIARSKRVRNVVRLALSVGLGMLSSGCQETPGTAGGAAVCTYGQILRCGLENKCTATCLPDLSAYGPCSCGDAGADATDAGQKDAR